MLTVLWGAKGGSGTTVVACALALVIGRSEPVLLVDTAGDAPAVLGLSEPTGPGVHDWIASSTANPASLAALQSAATDSLSLVPRGRVRSPIDAPRWADLGQYLAACSLPVVVDAGTGVPPPGLLEPATSRILVTRACYIALRHAVTMAVSPTGIVLVHEPGRALTSNDVAHALGAPVVAEVQIDPAVARTVDAGLLTTRLPRTIAVPLRELAA